VRPQSLRRRRRHKRPEPRRSPFQWRIRPQAQVGNHPPLRCEDRVQRRLAYLEAIAA